MAKKPKHFQPLLPGMPRPVAITVRPGIGFQMRLDGLGR